MNEQIEKLNLIYYERMKSYNCDELLACFLGKDYI